MRAWWEKIRDLLDPGMRQQITRLGFFFTVTVALIGLAAFISANNLLFLLFAALLSTLLISGFVSRLGLAALELNLELPEHIAARRGIRCRIVLRNRKWIYPSFSLQLKGADGSGLRDTLYIPLIPARGQVTHPAELWFNKRGLHNNNTFWLESRFPFGFTHRRARVRVEHEVLVYPSIDPRPELELMLAGLTGEIDARRRGRGTDFYRIRPYTALESSRHVDWKATAHTGELQVREFASEQDQVVTVFLDLWLPPKATSEWFEMAVDCTAFLVWRLHESGNRVRMITQRFDRSLPDEATVYDVLRYLALVEPVFNARLLTPDETNLSIAISARHNEAAAQGWMGPGLPQPDGWVQPANTASAAAGSATGTGPDNNHRAGKGGD